MKRLKLIVASAILVSLILIPMAWAQDSAPASPLAPQVEAVTTSGCSACHDGKADEHKNLSPTKTLTGSVHRDLDCTSCHESISMEDIEPDAAKPHGVAIEPVNCGECHDEEAEAYQKHGRMKVGQDSDIPTCWSCHGTHEILPSSDLHSRVHPINMAKTCMGCHTDENLVLQHDILAEGPIRLYERSVHGKASKKGLRKFANCNNCHSGPGPEGRPSAHRILGPADPESTIFRANIPVTCGKCHGPIAADYWEGIHGQLVKRGEVDAPVCTTCHGEHGIISPSDPASPVSAARVATQTCSPCHESVVLNEKYGIPGGRLKSYVDSYHGHKAKAGDVHVANCASCHGAHRILPSTDPTSSIHVNNLQATCGECHPGITPEVAKTGIHTTATGLAVGWPNFFRVFYLVLIVVTIGLMLIHNVADWVRQIKRMNRKTFVIRLTMNETMQHWVLAISFTLLAVSGFALRFSESWWVQLLFGWGDGRGFEFRGDIHRISAVVFIVVTIWHLLYLFTRRGRTMFREMIAGKRDLINIKENSLYFLGRRKERPQFGTFTYMEKCEYWAMAWGAVIMTGTGLLLWFDNYFIRTWDLPKGVLDVMLVIHYYEAWLATLAIVVWHGYGTIFSPGVYPMNPAWMSGRMPKDMYEHEHPAGPKLKGRVYRAFYEDEVEKDNPESSATEIEHPDPGPAHDKDDPPEVQ